MQSLSETPEFQVTFCAPGRRALEKPKASPRRETLDLEAAAFQWVCARVMGGREFGVADDLSDLGFRTFAPHGIRVQPYARIGPQGRRGRRERDYPVFGGYVFVGQPAGLTVAQRSHPHILNILQNSGAYCRIPALFISEAVRLWVGGEWDGTKPRFPPGRCVRITAGALEGWSGVIESLPSELRAVVKVKMFGGDTRAIVDTAALEIV